MIIEADVVMPMTGEAPIKKGAVAIRDGKICAVGSAGEIETAFTGEEIKDYGDATILPGLTDMHVHVGNCQTQPDISLYNSELKGLMAAQELKKALKKGITAIRDVGSETGFCVTLKVAAGKEYIVSPRLITCGPGIVMTGGHCWDMETVVQADSPWGVRKAIRKNIREGSDWIKLMTSHRMPIPEFTQEELDAAADECHRVGKKICVHSASQPSIEMCIRAGVDTIEHATFLTPEQAVRMKAAGIAWTPTIFAYSYVLDNFVSPRLCAAGFDPVGMAPEMIAETYNRHSAGNPALGLGSIDRQFADDYCFFKRAADAYRENFMKLADTGVTVLAGTDMVIDGAPVTPVAEELGLMVSFGMSPTEAIKTATSNAAAVLGLAEVPGRLCPGARADIAVFSGDASADIGALKNCKATFQNGKQVE
jgi:imidazolonepropionase-like amidohydrolase